MSEIVYVIVANKETIPLYYESTKLSATEDRQYASMYNERSYAEQDLKEANSVFTNFKFVIHPVVYNDFYNGLPLVIQNPINQVAIFTKCDKEKLRADLLPAKALLVVAEVLTHGAAKYGADNWRKVDDTSRYKAALARHLLAYLSGEIKDADSGKSHLAHVACNALFLIELEKK